MKISLSLFTFFTALAFFVQQFFGGTIWWAFGSVGLYPFTHLPTLLVFVFFIISLYLYLWKATKTPIENIIVFFVLSFSAATSLLLFGNLKQVIIGAYVFMPLIFGMLSYKILFYKYQKNFYSLSSATLIIIVSGAVLDYLVGVPWRGFGLEIGGMEIDGSKDWEAGDYQRIAGFSRASFNLATQCVILGLICVIYGKRRFLKIFFWLLAFIGISLSTSKVSIGSWAFLACLFVFLDFANNKMKITCIKFLPIALFIVGFAMPCLSFYFYEPGIDYSNFRFQFEDDRQTWWMSSFFNGRFLGCWPHVFQIVFDYGSVIFGNGLGGIGTFAMEHLKNPGDNLYVYLFGLFGISSFLLYPLWLRKIISLKFGTDRNENFFWLFSVYYLLLGISSGIEGKMSQFFLGASIAHFFNCTRNFKEYRI